MKRQGFTLIELLVVIAIIAILMGILMPALHAARDHAVRMHCISNIKCLSMAWLMYKDDYDDKVVSAMTRTMSDTSAPARSSWVRLANNYQAGATMAEKIDALKAGALARYVSSETEVYRCPSDKRIKIPTMVTCRSFSIANGANGEDYPAGACVPATRYGQIKQPSAKYIFLEDFDQRGDNVNSWCLDFPSTLIDPLAIWHNKRSSFGFADGHGEMHKWQDKVFTDWCERCLNYTLYQQGSFANSLAVPVDQMSDYRFLTTGFPCVRHR